MYLLNAHDISLFIIGMNFGVIIMFSADLVCKWLELRAASKGKRS